MLSTTGPDTVRGLDTGPLLVRLGCLLLGNAWPHVEAARRYHQYKFIVDGEWRHDEAQPFMPDPLGNVNNWLFVRRHDSPHQSG